jgi:hypothetical protein
MGVRTARSGEAVAEIDLSLSKAFEQVEAYLRKEWKVTFVNASIGKIEAENRKVIFAVDLTTLTTGKTGLTVLAMDHDRRAVDPYASREIADAILKDLQATKTHKIPMKLDGVKPRES